MREITVFPHEFGGDRVEDDVAVEDTPDTFFRGDDLDGLEGGVPGEELGCEVEDSGNG